MNEELKQKAKDWCLNHTFADTDSAEGIRLQNAYIAGATENGIQWHDLRENPNDLPKEFDINKGRWELEKRITKHIVQNQDGERVCCLNGTWYYEDGDEAKYVIAWCEIPLFKE